ncbi:MAG: AAA family ATPase [Phycisphaerales bacterium]|nr:AAA family ATPase [Phycisphaerales bacterium]
MNTLPPHDTRALALPELPGGPSHAPQGQTNILTIVHRLLRGRYLLVSILAVLGASAGGVGGYLSQTPKYRSEGLIRIQPKMGMILYKTEQSEVPPMFTSFVNTQANLLKNSRVISRAMDSREWRANGRGRSPEAERRFRQSLQVTTSREAPELIFVSFTDVKPNAAKTGLEAVIQAYDEIFSHAEAKQMRDVTIRTLEERRRTTEAEISSRQQQIEQEAKEFGTDDLDRLHDWHINRLLEVDDEVSVLELRLAKLGGPPPPAPTPDPALAQPTEPVPLERPSPEALADVDPEMKSFVARRREADSLISKLKSRGVGDKHEDMQAAKIEVEELNKTIEAYIDSWMITSASAPVDGSVGANRPETPAKLAEDLRLLQQKASEWREEAVKIGNRRLAIGARRREIDQFRNSLDEVTRRLDEISVESRVQDTVGRIETIMPDTPPTSPNVDSRFKTGAMGFVLGGGFPVALIALFGLLDRRFRYSDEAKPAFASARVFGILPELPQTGAGAEQTAAAAHCVHQMRTMLEIGGAGKKVYAITSATAGDGKTSLTISLGLSFAASGANTLLIDFDLIGRGLSSTLKMSSPEGIGEALSAGTVNGSVVATKIDRLSVLASGRDDDRFISRLSEPVVRRFLDSLRDRYDVILIDTGPILGSLEANFVSAAADGVVLVVGRGQHRVQVQRAYEQLANLGANVLGMVFNRASTTDFNRSAASASFRSVSVEVANRAPTPDSVPEEFSALDPISRTVAMDIRR